MSVDAYEQRQLDCEVYLKLKEAEMEAKTTTERLTGEEVFAGLRARIQERKDI